MPDDSDKFENEVFEKLQERKYKIKTWSSLVAGMTSSIAIAVTAAMVSGLFFGQGKTLNRQELTDKINKIEKLYSEQLSSISEINKELDKINTDLKSVQNLPENAQWKTETTKISQNVTSISERINALEVALTLDPAKALAVPILRKDLDNTDKSLRSEITQTRVEIERMYDQNKWFIALMFTIALSVLGMSVSSFINRRDT